MLLGTQKSCCWMAQHWEGKSLRTFKELYPNDYCEVVKINGVDVTIPKQSVAKQWQLCLYTPNKHIIQTVKTFALGKEKKLPSYWDAAYTLYWVYYRLYPEQFTIVKIRHQC